MTLMFKFFKIMLDYLSIIHSCFRRAENIFHAESKSVSYIIINIRKYPAFTANAKTKLQNFVVLLKENNTYLKIKPKNFSEYRLKLLYLLGYCFRALFVFVFMFFWFICYHVREILLCIAYFFYYNICFYLSYIAKNDNYIVTVMFKSLIYFLPYIFIALFSKAYIYDEFTAYNRFMGWVHPMNHVLPQHNLVLLVFSVFIPFFYLWLLYFWQRKDRDEFIFLLAVYVVWDKRYEKIK